MIGAPGVRRKPLTAPTHRTSSVITTTSATSISGTFPSSPAVAGDLGVIVLSAYSGQSPTTPSGWTRFGVLTDPAGYGLSPAGCSAWLYKKGKAEGYLVSGDLGATISFTGLANKPMQLVMLAYANAEDIYSQPNVFWNTATEVSYNVPQHATATAAGPSDLVVGVVSLGGYISAAVTVTTAPTGATIRQTNGSGSGTSARGVAVWDMPAPS